MRALIGHTGFVGGTLAGSRSFDSFFNSSNIDQIRGQRFDDIVCAGVNAVKWQANRNPHADREGIKRLTDALSEATATSFTLVSTIDVYVEQNATDEKSRMTREGLHAYGLHRLELEDWVRSRFTDVSIARLPALFGPGLKKNVIFDLLNNNMVEQINPESSFQWYPVQRLADDLDVMKRHRLRLVNFVTEPLSTAEIISAHFNHIRSVGAQAGRAVHQNIRTLHDTPFGGSGGYLMRRNEVMRALGAWIESLRSRP